jgi:ureidoacrylate peracid hydrolase
VDILRWAFILIEDVMHKVTVRQEIIDRVLARRGRYHWFDELDPRRTALVVIDMQELFCAPGAPAEVPGSRGIVEPINALAGELRKFGVPVIWVLHANAQSGGRSDWELFFNYIVADEVREKTRQSLTPGRQRVWSGLTVAPADTTIIKNRYSALIAGSSGLERLLRSLDVDTVLIAGTKTNICCEATARDAMMLDFKVVMVSDCCAALSDDEHRAALENMIQQFGDVMTGDEVLERLRRQSNR